MTIDEAIKYADMLSCNVNAFEVSKQFGAMCADALRKVQEANKKPKGENAVPETWQRRMQREYHETKERYEKLNRLLVKHAAGTLDFTLKCPIELLKAQREHMSDYLYTLEIRAEIEGVNLYD